MREQDSAALIDHGCIQYGGLTSRSRIDDVFYDTCRGIIPGSTSWRFCLASDSVPRRFTEIKEYFRRFV